MASNRKYPITRIIIRIIDECIIRQSFPLVRLYRFKYAFVAYLSHIWLFSIDYFNCILTPGLDTRVIFFFLLQYITDKRNEKNTKQANDDTI